MGYWDLCAALVLRLPLYISLFGSAARTVASCPARCLASPPVALPPANLLGFSRQPGAARPHACPPLPSGDSGRATSRHLLPQMNNGVGGSARRGMMSHGDRSNGVVTDARRSGASTMMMAPSKAYRLQSMPRPTGEMRRGVNLRASS